MPVNRVISSYVCYRIQTDRYLHVGKSFSWIGFNITLERIARPFIFNIYAPTTILVMASWISFLIPVEIVPGRYKQLFFPASKTPVYNSLFILLHFCQELFC